MLHLLRLNFFGTSQRHKYDDGFFKSLFEFPVSQAIYEWVDQRSQNCVEDREDFGQILKCVVLR